MNILGILLHLTAFFCENKGLLSKAYCVLTLSCMWAHTCAAEPLFTELERYGTKPINRWEQSTLKLHETTE